MTYTLKSPQNGRGLMNYGLTQMEKGDYVRALELLHARARSSAPITTCLKLISASPTGR